MLVWFATLASKKEIEARLDALEATVAAQNATIAALRDAISSRVAPPLRTGRHFKFIGRAGCCTYSSAAPRVDLAPLSCVCETTCALAPKCQFFTYVPTAAQVRGACVFCEELATPAECETSTEKLLDEGHGVWNTWARTDAAPTPAEEATAQAAALEVSRAIAGRQEKPCPWNRQIVSHDRNWVWDKQLKKNARAHHTPISKFLGLGTDLDVSAEPPLLCTQHATEETVFRKTCGELISRMDDHLSSTRNRRGVAFVFLGSSEWGWGNLLPSVYALHYLCVSGGRFCHVVLQDNAIGSVIGYANGESWDIDGCEAWNGKACKETIEKLEQRYNMTEPVQHQVRSDRPWNSQEGLQNLTQTLRDDEAPLLLYVFNQRMWLDVGTWWFQQPLADVPLVAPPLNASAPAWHLQGRRLDRCFNRYVSAPIFLAQLSPRARRLVDEAAASPPDVSLHLRTMVNHMEKWR